MDVSLQIHIKKRIEEWRERTKTFFSLNEEDQNMVHILVDMTLQRIFRDFPAALLPLEVKEFETQSALLRNFYTIDFGGSIFLVPEDERFERMKTRLLTRWIGLAYPTDFEFDLVPVEPVAEKPRRGVEYPTTLESMQGLDNLMDEYDNALQYGGLLRDIVQRVDNGIGYDKGFNTRINIYKGYFEDSLWGLADVPMGWEFTTERFQYYQSQRQAILDAVDKVVEEELKWEGPTYDTFIEYAKARLMIGATRHRDIAEEEEKENGSTQETREWFHFWFVRRHKELRYRFDEIQTEYQDRVSQLHIMTTMGIPSHTAIKLLYLLQENYSRVPKYMKDVMFTDPRVLGELKLTWYRQYGIPPEVFGYYLVTQMNPFGTGDRNMLFLATLFRTWSIQMGDENARTFDMMASTAKWNAMYQPLLTTLPLLNITVFSPDQVADVLNSVMHCVSIIRNIMDEQTTTRVRKKIWDESLTIVLPNRPEGIKLRPHECIKRARTVIEKTKKQLAQKLPLIENLNAFMDFIYDTPVELIMREEGEEEEDLRKEDAISIERLKKASLSFTNKGRDLFLPYKIRASSVVRNEAWKAYWGFWIPTIRAIFPTKYEARLIFVSNMKGSKALVELAYQDLVDEESRIDAMLHPSTSKGKRKRSPLAPITAKLIQKYFPHLLAKFEFDEAPHIAKSDEYW